MISDNNLRISLVICTYQRPDSVCRLLDSVLRQTVMPHQILIIDASLTAATEDALKEKKYSLPIEYIMVTPEHRGLTRQRNYGVSKVAPNMDLVAFLDDDVVLLPDYFEKLLEAFVDVEVVGASGYILDHTNPEAWHQKKRDEKISFNQYEFDGWVCKEASRNTLRKRFGLLSKEPPCKMPSFSNGRSAGSLPPSGKMYPAEYLMGGVSAYRTSLFKQIKFSHYFEGYGLYEDLDFSLRASFRGKLYVHTGAQLYHYHDASGRPNSFKYGKMVIRNGWYVWRVKYEHPSWEGRIKFYATAILLTCVRYLNSITGPKRIEALREAWGRTYGLFSLCFNKPIIESR